MHDNEVRFGVRKVVKSTNLKNKIMKLEEGSDFFFKEADII